MPPRFYCPRFSAREATLEGDELHHLRSVRRLAAGDEVEVFDGAGRVGRCRLVRVARHEAELAVLAVTEGRPPAVALTVATAIAKGGRMDWLVEKVTELGATGVWPLVAERSEVTGRGEEKREKWHRRAVEAAKQCGRLWLPEIAEPMSLAEATARLSSAGFDAVLLADPSAEAGRVADALSAVVGARHAVPVLSAGVAASAGHPPLRIVGFIGPEGGFTAEETAALRAAGAQPVRLGEHILRVETAAVALAAAVAALW